MSSTFPQRPLPTLEQLSTPCLVLERGKLARNLIRMAAALSIRGIGLRPHLKTAKSVEIARLASPTPFGPITVSTLREAEYFSHHGWRDIFYAVGLGPGKLARAVALMRAGVRLVTMVDHPDAAAAVRDCARRERLSFRTVIEIDCGEHRGGVLPDSSELLVIARLLGSNFAGVATHGGQSYGERSREGFTRVAQVETDALRTAAARLHAAGFQSEILSLGSSPTALVGVDLAGITELRAGVYMMGDAFQTGIGACAMDDIALSVLAEVIGRPANRPHEFLIDAGAFALSKDSSTAVLAGERNAGFGFVCDLDGQVQPGLRVTKVWQEHGLVVSPTPLLAGAFRIGDRVRILPNHACPTAAAHDRYFVVAASREVVGEWTRVNGW
ncbi:MAG: alanine racemase [Candidatus Didemnitutus sp.]|nr:alanine racemase [Candidatus Didemnitutus sp.]